MAKVKEDTDQAFLLTLSDSLRTQIGVEAVGNRATQLIAERLNADRVYLVSLNPDDDTVVVTHETRRQDLPPLQGSYRSSDFPSAIKEIFERTIVYTDVRTDARLTDLDRLSFAGLGAVGFIAAPIRRGNESMIWAAGALSTQARSWTASEVALFEDAVERSWAAVEREKAEVALSKGEERYRTLFETMGEGFALCGVIRDATGQVVDLSYLALNRALEQQTGLDRRLMIGRKFSEVFPREDFDRFLPFYARAANSDEPVSFEQYAELIDRWFVISVYHNKEDEISIFYRDITDRKRIEATLLEADRRKDEFLAMLAHELRNPMSTIRSGLQILTLISGGDEMVSSTVTMMNRQTDHLVKMVDDLLDVSRISRGKIELKKERINLVDIVNQAVESVRTLYQEPQRSLQVDLPASAIYLEGDATRLTQVVTNLLTNGARYTSEQGQVGLSLSHQNSRNAASPTGRKEAILQVRDNGIGLAADQLSAIFELFVQVDNSTARSKGGLGVGLTLVKRLVEMHDGRVEARSEGLGKGSTFTIHLPTLTAPTEPAPVSTPQATDSTTNRRILVIDDNADAASTLAVLLKLKDYEAHTRTSGRAGIEAAEALQPSAILLDIGMPEQDGYTTCRLIREQAWGRDLVVIALTGYGQEEDRQRTRESGFDGHLVKPVDLGALIKMLTDLMDKRTKNG